VTCFDHLNRKTLSNQLEAWGAEGPLLRRIGKGLHVGVLEGVELSPSKTHTAQRSMPSRYWGAS
jgi:hypothetical protein